ncbi:MAG TPA: hypothetical protein VJZ27_13055, partial [Aggregatilineales bacterium]|nr:hypothetical protein [Aggregatilineales bacterium]
MKIPNPHFHPITFWTAALLLIVLMFALPQFLGTLVLLILITTAVLIGLTIFIYPRREMLRRADFWKTIYAEIFQRENTAGRMPPVERFPLSGSERIFWIVTVLTAAIIGAYYTVHLQTAYFHPNFIMDWQHPMMQDVLNENAGNPWQYRLFSNYLLDFLVHRAWDTGFDYQDGIEFVFLNVRYAQNFIIFLAMIVYYRLLRLSYPGVMLGMLLFVWAVSHSLINSNYNYDTYFDLMFYLFAGIAIL